MIFILDYSVLIFLTLVKQTHHQVVLAHNPICSSVMFSSLGAESEFSVAEVRLQQGRLHPKFTLQAKGDAQHGFCEHWAAASRDFQAQQLDEREDERVRESGERIGEHKEARPGADADVGTAGQLLQHD